MAHRCRQRLLVLLALILILSIVVPLVMAGGEVTWYWKDTNASGFNGHASDKLMDKIAPQGSADSSVTLSPGERAWWYADKAAEESLTFPAGDWNVTYWAETNDADGCRAYHRIFKIDSAGNKTGIGTQKWESLNSYEGVKELTETFAVLSSTNLQVGDRIAFEVLASGLEDGEWLKIYYNSTSHNSRLVSPPNSPHYPCVSNRPPVLVPIGDKTVDEGSLLEFTISASDPDGDPLTYLASNLPTGAIFDVTTRQFSWHPDYTQSGTYPNVHFEVSDGSLADSEDITITVNNVNRPPPSPTLLVPSDGLCTNNQTPAFDWTDVTDPDGDPVTYDLQVDDDSDFSSREIDQSGLTSSEYTPGFDLDEGTHYWRARSSDGSDASDWTPAWTVTIDVTPPTIIYSYPTAGGETSWYNSDPGNVIDIAFGWIANSPLDYAQWKIGEGTWNDVFTADQSSDYTTNWGITWASLAEGENQISIRVADKAGNVATDPYVAGTSGFLYRKDTSAPSSTLTSPADGANLNSLASIDGTAADPGSSGVQKVEVSIKRNSDGKYWDGSSWVETQTWLQAIGTTSWSYTWTPDVDGSFTVRSKATDNAGNVETPGAGNTFNFDMTPPGNVTNFTAMPGDTLASLSWTNPSDLDFKGTMVRYRTDGTYPTDETDGTLVCDRAASPGSSDSFTHTGLTNGTTYYYTAFPYDTVSNYAPAMASAQDSATPAAVVPGDILINEVAFDETNDWIEFYVLKAASYYQGLRIYEGGSKVKELPAITASAGDYIVLHFKGDPVNDESDATGKGANGYWDIYTTDTGLTATDNVVRIQRVGTELVNGTDTIDAVIWSNNNGDFTANQKVANDLVAAGHWDTGAVFSDARDSDAWTDSDDVSAGKSIGRDASSTDTNSRTNWYLFTSQTPGAANPTMGTPGDVLINEVAPSEDKAWIEFYNASGESINIQYWLVIARSTPVKTFPAYAIAPGEYIALNFDGDPTDDETVADTNGNGYRDFYTAEDGLIATDNVIILEDGASTMIDALAFANNDGTWANPQQSAFNGIVNAGHWEGTPDGGAGINEPESADWNEGDEGKSLGRDSSSTDTNARADWHLFTSQTPGEANPVLGSSGDVLINEVAPSEDEDWIEFFNASGEGINIQYWLVKERSTVVKTFPAFVVGPEEYFVLNFAGNPADDEIVGDTNGNGYRDFYATDSGLTGTDNVIILEDGASTVIDALAFANNDGTWADAQQTAFNVIVEAGHWEGTVDGGAAVNEPECADWSKGGKGKSLGRDAWSKDTNSKNGWYSSLHTKGEVNPGWPHSVTVTADPASIPADDTSTSTIRATVKDSNDKPVANGTTVVFATDLGTLSDTITGTVDGVATVTLRSGTVPGKATVTAKSLRASGQISVQFTFIPTQIGTRIQLPAIDNDGGWETLIQVQNAGDEDTGAIVFFWGEYSGQCPKNDPGPIGVACMMVPENAVWTLRSQIPSSARSVIVYSVKKDLFDKACKKAAAADKSDEWKKWEDGYKDTGEPVAVIVQRQGPNDYGTVVSSAYTGISEGMEGSGPPYQYFAPYAMRQYHGLDTETIIQNSGQRCTSVWLRYQKQGGNCRFSYSEHVEQLAPGESIRVRVPEVLGVKWLGSIYVTANEPLGIIVDQSSFLPSEDQGALLTYRARPYELTMDTIFYANLVFRELSGWGASIQVQNLTQESLPTFVTVEFFDSSGDSILFLGDWVCPAGGTTFYLPAITSLGVEYTGAAVIRSHGQVGYPGGQEIEGQPIFAVVDLKKVEIDAQGGSYNAHAESENMGASAIVLPFLSRDYQGVTSLIAVRNSSNCNDVKLRLEVRDETGTVVSLVGDFWLRVGHVKLIDLASVDSVAPGFAGAGIAEVIDVHQLCDTNGDGEVDQSPLIPSVVVVNRGAGPGDVTWVYEGIPAR